MIQDIAPHTYRNEYKNMHPTKASYILHYQKDTALLRKKQEGFCFPTWGELKEQNPDLEETLQYLFTIDEHPFFLADTVIYEGMQDVILENVQSFRVMQPRHLAFAGITGYQLQNWYHAHQFCGVCGSKTLHDQKERMLRCPQCGQMTYPKISPAVIVGITDGSKLLMSKYAGREYKKYALIAGFAEIGETIEETVAREVMEEVGLSVKNIRYYKSQPWSFTDTLLLGFYADLDGDSKITLDEEELALAEWFEREDIPVSQKNISLTNEMILAFKNKEV